MALDCTPEQLATYSTCYCFDEITKDKVEIYLLAVIAGLNNLTPSQLAENASCYCYDALTMEKVKAYLLCQVANTLP